jgi:putative oxidoreductase
MRSAVTLLAARILLGALFLVAGYNKITNVSGTTAYMGGKAGLPAPELMTWAVIAIELLGGLLLVIGWKTRWVAWGMAIFTLLTAIIGHAFWKDPGQTTQFLKNMAIVGGFLALATSGGGALSADRR